MKKHKAKTTTIKNGTWTVFSTLCKGCGICLVKCPTKALVFGKDFGVYLTPAPRVLAEKCNLCKICEISCPDCAIRVEKND